MQITVANSKGGVGKTTIVMSLADLIDAQIIEYDLQATIAKCANIVETSTGGKVKRHIPVNIKDVSARHIINDTPPYNSDENAALFEASDLIIIPVKLSEGDLVACKGVIDTLRSINQAEKAYIVFNEVRKPKTSTYSRVKGYFDQSYSDIKRAKTELSNLVGFRSIMSMPIYGKAKQEMFNLIKELKIE